MPMSAKTHSRKNVVVLATCQMLLGSTRTLLISTAPLIAYGIVGNKALTTLPTALVVVGMALGTVPASLLMRAIGRRAGFITGAFIGALGGIVVCIAIIEAQFWLLCVGTLFYGLFAGFGQFYRFAAADVAARDFKSKAISLVLAGGVVAAFVGPQLAKVGQNLIAADEFLGAYLFLIALTVLTAAILIFLRIPNLTPSERRAGQRPIAEIMAQPVFVAATLAAMMSQGVMNFLMTATPLAMAQAHHQFADTAFVIGWHSFGMFAPGFITGSLIKRFGEVRIILTGILLELVCVAIALSGEELAEFWLAMLLLGVGWNFAFTGGTSLLTEAYAPAEWAKTQGAMNFLMYGFVAILSLSSGALVHYFGWAWVNLSAIPLLLVAGVATLWFAASQRVVVAQQS